MKYQKSPLPYLTLLVFFLVGLPLLDYKINENLVLNYQISTGKSNAEIYEISEEKQNWITQTLIAGGIDSRK